ncbi:MAG: hypothetical protein ACE5GK_00170 [Nitrospiria bacterium]
MGDPLFQAVLFSFLAICGILLGLKTLRGAPPGFEDKICPACKHSNHYEKTTCEQCGEALEDRWEENE